VSVAEAFVEGCGGWKVRGTPAAKRAERLGLIRRVFCELQLAQICAIDRDRDRHFALRSPGALVSA